MFFKAMNKVSMNGHSSAMNIIIYQQLMVVMVLGLVAGPLLFSAVGAASSFSQAFSIWSAVALAGCGALWRVRGRVDRRDVP